MTTAMRRFTQAVLNPIHEKLQDQQQEEDDVSMSGDGNSTYSSHLQ